MFDPIPLNQTYHLGIHEFELYDISGFDFKEELKFPHTNGIYCFSTPLYGETEKGLSKKKFQVLYYLGKTKDFAERFDRHHKAHELLRLKPLCISVCHCEENAEESIENQLLSQFSFPLNIVDNSNYPKDLPTVVRED